MSYIYNANEKDATKFTHDYNTNLLKNRDPQKLKTELKILKMQDPI